MSKADILGCTRQAMFFLLNAQAPSWIDDEQHAAVCHRLEEQVLCFVFFKTFELFVFSRVGRHSSTPTEEQTVNADG